MQQNITESTATVRVTQAHIDEGKRMDCESCPIALAVREALALAPDLHMRVGCNAIVVYEDYRAFLAQKGHRIEIPLPKVARNFIFDFDNAANHVVRPLLVKPFEFTARVFTREATA